jgi:hypothetical protein
MCEAKSTSKDFTGYLKSKYLCLFNSRFLNLATETYLISACVRDIARTQHMGFYDTIFKGFWFLIRLL